MTWEFSQPQPGDAIRVLAGSIYHMGIFVSDDEVIQFGPNPALMAQTSPQEIRVMRVGIDDFLQGGFLQVAHYTKREQKKKRLPDAVIAEARRRLGERGYDILRNNCEHFVHECLFGEHTSTQVDGVRAFLRGHAMVTVFVAPVDENAAYTPAFPPLRDAYNCNTSHAGLRTQRAVAWRLLAQAMQETLKIDLRKTTFAHLPTGQWTCPACCFSLSHTEGAAAAVVSKTPVGVDLERCDRDLSPIAGRMLSEAELTAYHKVPENEQNRFLVKKWTQKEALFKQRGEAAFSPQQLVPDAAVHTVTAQIGGETYFVSVAHAEAKLVRVVVV